MNPLPFEITPMVVSTLAQQLAVLAVLIAGFLIMFGSWQWAKRAFLLALVFVVVAAFGPEWLPKP